MELERLHKAREEELLYLKQQNEIEVSKLKQVADIEVAKFKNLVESLGSDTIKAVASAGQDFQVCTILLNFIQKQNNSTFCEKGATLIFRYT